MRKEVSEMPTTKDEENKNRVVTPTLFNSFFWNLVIPIVVVFIGLIIEYWSGLFQQTAQSSRSLNYYVVWFIAIALFASVLFAKSLLSVWYRPHRHMREYFALLALCTEVPLTFATIASLIYGFMPWTIHKAIIQALISKNILKPDTRLVDYVLLSICYIIIYYILKKLHLNWRGLKSVVQHQREQRNETIGFIADGLSELRRLLRRDPPLKPYSEPSLKPFIPQLEPVTDSLVWKDQAKELILLSSSSYAFDPNSGWHDREHCWVGRNVNTGDLVFLHPCQGEISDVELKEFLKHAERIIESENRKAEEIIVAAKGNTAKPIDTWKGLPIRYETEASLLDCLVDFKDYFNDIKRRALINRLPDSDLALDKVYVPSHFLLSDGVKQGASIEEYLNNWLNELSQRQLALLGEYGQGKSTAALMWAYHLVCEEAKPFGRIPLLIELRGTSPRNLTPLQLLGAWAAQYNINPRALMRLLIAGRLVLIFEGFDEMALVGDVEMRLKHFRTLWQFAYPQAKILITGRPNLFLDEEEMKASLGISKPIGILPYCEALRLSPFNSEQIKEALRAYKKTVIDQIHALVVKNSRFQELVSRPSLLHIVAVLWERERLYEKVDQLTSAYVMDLFIRHSYRRQGLKETDSPGFMALTTLEREYFMTGIAAYMTTKQLPNQITNTQLNEIIADLIACIPESVSTESPVTSAEATRPLRRRIQDAEHGTEHVKTDVRACGLLVDDPASPGTFRFGHKSFMEYLFAAVVAERIQNVKPEKTRAIFKATNAQIEDVLLLPVAIEFLSELLVGVKEGKETEHAAKELSIANRLFGTIVSESTMQAVYLRPAAFTEALTHCLAKRFSTAPGLIVQILPLFVLTIIMTMLTFTLFLFRKGTTGYPRSDVHISLMSMMIFTTILILFYLPTTVVRRRLGLWNHICKELGIQDKTLHIVIGTSLIPWVRKQPFDYYLPRILTSNNKSEHNL